MHALRQWVNLPATVQLLLVTQMLFNIGFYLVVPFLALYMTDSLAASAAMVGFVLGLRTFSQQGMFFVGGALADWWGIRPVLLTGIAIRIAGFALAGYSTSLPELIVAVIFIGFGAALFSPAMDTALAFYGVRLEGVSRQDLFAMDAWFSRIGELVGPVLGTVLIPLGFQLVAYSGAALFGIIFVLHLLITPAIETPTRQSALTGFREVFSNKKFVIFAVAYSVYLVGYNQLYQGLPVEVERASGSQAALGSMFIIASVVSVFGQMPLNGVAARMGRSRAIGVGFAIQAAAFVWVAVTNWWDSLAVAVVFVVTLSVGQMLAVPVSRDLVGVLARERRLGTYFGVLNSFGGLAVLIAATAVGPLYDDPSSSRAWWAIAVALLIAGVVAVLVARTVPPASSAYPDEPDEPDESA
ncbi:MFS transporter [Corynebacterium cystitidis]|uniref:Na+/melibiose symporter n=1 Tax=Corynebacterium cystitidis DSM 20524 TaxID=1121357 RepID=A0A1H9WJ41_9CORY|nr:MFS transporter [Corynebacterium cystitidis]WJY81359.1 Multidrug resistance protein MdtH [Corynebacterium cystitidis DSM 20524]SES33956.1 Na+/melibiose symporter [Corynebacterium cystitidis DSM 20524]SNV88121.1 major facilitator superfamily permease [Corynebacterium cystitidis]